jgi:hypothetical protein
MKFEINFNRENDDSVLELIGAKLVPTNSTKYPPFEIYEVELNGFEDLEELLRKVDNIKGDLFSAVVSFDPPVIFLDNKI